LIGIKKVDNVPVITLLTDFGLEDEYVGVMKGTILSINPQSVIVDVTHQVSPHHVLQAAYILEASYRYFPAGTIHVTIVDPGVGTDRRIIVLQKDDHVFLAPDNGVLSMVFETGSIEFSAAVENDNLFLKPVSRTFHGRDIFAPVAAHLSKGLPPNRLGPEISPNQLTRLEIVKPYISENRELIGSVIAVDYFGNLTTDIDRTMIEEFTADKQNDRVSIHVSARSIIGLSDAYEANDVGQPLAVIGSREYLEIAVYQGSAREFFGAQIGDRVRVTIQG
jgi:S-adenosylmethionine hydrolase